MPEKETPLYCGAYGFHQMGEGEYAGSSAADVIKRMKQAAHCTNMYELAIHLKTRYSHMADAKRRNIMPIVWLREFVKKYSETSPRWLLTGEIDEAWNKGFRLCGGFPEDYGPMQ